MRARVCTFGFIFLCFIFATICAAPAPQQPNDGPSLGELRGVAEADLNYDGSRVIVRLRNGEIGFWDVAEGKRAPGDLAPDATAECYRISEDRRFVLIGFEDGAVVFDANTAMAVSPPLKAKVRCELHTSAVFAPDGATVVIFEPKEASVWKVASGEKVAAVPYPEGPHEDAPPFASFTSDGAACFVMSPDGIVTRHETQTWSAVGKPMRHPRLDTAYEFGFNARADGKWIATFDDAGENGPKGYLQIWDGLTGKPVGAPLLNTNGFTARFLAEPDRILILPARGNAAMRALPSLKLLYPVPAHDEVEGPSAEMSPDGKWLITWGSDRTIRVLDSTTGKLKDHQPEKATIRNVLVGPDPAALFIVYDNSTFMTAHFHDNYVFRLRLPDLNTLGAFRSFANVARTSLSRDGSRLMVQEGGDHDQRLLIFRAADLMPVPSTPP